MKPFKIDFNNSKITDLRSRLMETRLPDDLAHRQLDTVSRHVKWTKHDSDWQQEWKYGIPLRIIQEWLDYSLKNYNITREINRLNNLPMFQAWIDQLEISLHFIWWKNDGIPLLLLHGWPGSFLEFEKVGETLAQRGYNVIVPSLPGYGFSEIPRYYGWGPWKIAQAMNLLMHQICPGQRYVIQGGDWGAFIARAMALQFPSRIAGIHLNMISAPPDDQDQITQWEKNWMERNKNFDKEEMAYYMEQRTKPQTLGYGLTDSPVGIMAWILEKFHTWTHDGLPTPPSSNQEYSNALLNNILLCYYLSGRIVSAARLYREARPDLPKIFYSKISTPTGVSVFPSEISLSPESWVKKSFNLVLWKIHEKGGHFAALERPWDLISDIEEFVKLEQVQSRLQESKI